MFTEEEIFKIEQKKTLAIVKKDIERALEGVSTAIHYLHETFEYESDVLDNACDELVDIESNLKGLVYDE